MDAFAFRDDEGFGYKLYHFLQLPGKPKGAVGSFIETDQLKLLPTSGQKQMLERFNMNFSVSTTLWWACQWSPIRYILLLNVSFDLQGELDAFRVGVKEAIVAITPDQGVII